MQAEIIVALVAAGSSLLVSLATGISQFLQTRANHRLERNRQKEQLINDWSNKALQETQIGLREACKALLRVQDEILLIIKLPSKIIISEKQKLQLVEARDHLLLTYRDYHTVLSDKHRINLDKARKKIVDIVLRLEIDQIEANNLPPISSDIVGELERAFVAIGHYHQQMLFSTVGSMQQQLIPTEEF